jgi:hypothetical protein
MDIAKASRRLGRGTHGFRLQAAGQI